MDKGLKVIFWNVRSLYNKIDTIRLEIDKINPDILNVCETWLHDDIENDFVSIKDYTLIRSDRKTFENGILKRGGGLCTYVRKTFICEDLIDHTLSNNNIEMHVMKYKLPYTRPIYIFNVYRPPAGDVDEFITTLSNSIGTYRNQKCDIFVGGDFNIDMHRKSSIDTKKLIKFFKQIQLKQEISTITRPDSNAILDLIASNCDIIKESGILDINISDHLPIFFIRKRIKDHKIKIDFKGRSYKNLTKDKVKEIIDTVDWSTFAQNNVDTCWNFLYNNMKYILDILCPEKSFKFAKNRPVWITNDLINLMKERDRCLKKYLSSRLEIDKIEMRKMRNLVNIAVKKARAEYVRDQLEIHKNDSKKFWKEINKLIPSKSSSDSQNFNNIKDENNEVITTNLLPTCINGFFANVGIELDKKIPPLTQIGSNINKIYDIEPLDTFEYITEEMLIQEIKNISVHKSSGLDLPSYFLKICFELLSIRLLVIMNKSLYTGYFPIKWRRAIIVPIPKISIPDEIGDLRPIALTPLPGKILERFVHTQLLSHLNRYNILTEFQNGFRKNHSTIDTIFKFTTDLQVNKNNKLNTIALYIDFKKAFDTVNHKLLIEKLENMQIKNNVLNWICSYLTNRTQYTRLGENISKDMEVKTGVPQGSILGPLFFLCYINDITNICKNTKILLYADDTVLYKGISECEKFLDMHNFQQDVDRLVLWCQRNRLSINIKKTKLVFYPANQNAVNNMNNVIKMQGLSVDYVTSYLYLGVDIDNMLTFKKHYNNTFKNVSHKLFILRKIRYMINVKAALDITKTMLCSVIDYGNIFLSSCNQADLNDMQILQNNALRCCYGVFDPRDGHILYLHKQANMKMLDIRRKKQILTCIWRNLKKGVIEIAQPIRQNRSAEAPNIYLPIPRTELFKKSVYYYGANLWNVLPVPVRLLDDIENFKLEINKIII